eukprot:1159708-Pelagomonas_calceolata.AAC.7
MVQAAKACDGAGCKGMQVAKACDGAGCKGMHDVKACNAVLLASLPDGNRVSSPDEQHERWWVASRQVAPEKKAAQKK